MVASLGGVEGLVVADLFAGSGALGLEALSRGATGAEFVERDRAAAGVLRSNLAELGLGGPGVTVHQCDVLAALAAVAAADVAFADPPYAFTGWAELLSGLQGAGFKGLAVLESDEEVAVPAGWRVLKVRRYGGTVVTLAQGTPASDPHRPAPAGARPDPPEQEQHLPMSGAS
jgi:16S rRNA (guanine966-N2)-methyltransferase